MFESCEGCAQQTSQHVRCALGRFGFSGETPWNPEILSNEPKLNDSSGAFYACGSLLGVAVQSVA